MLKKRLRAKLLIVFILLHYPMLSFSQTASVDDLDSLWESAHKMHETHPEESEKICWQLIRKALKISNSKILGNTYLTLGAIGRNKRQYAKSYEFFNKSLQIRRAMGDSNRVAAIYINRGINFLEESKYDSAISEVNYAIKIVESLSNPEFDVLGSEYLLVSNILEEYLEPTESIRYAHKCLNAYQKTTQKSLISMAHYALGNRYLNINQLDSALFHFNSAHANILEDSDNVIELADIMINKGIIYMRKGDFVQSAKCYQRAEEWLQQAGDEADYFHYYFNKSRLYFAQNQWAEGLQLLQKATPQDWEELDYLDQVFLMEELADAYQHLEQYDSAYYYLSASYSLRDTLYNQQKQKAFTRFQTERYKNETSVQALKTEQEASKARIYLMSTLLVLLLALIITIAYFQRKKAHLLIQKQQAKLHEQAVNELIQNSEMQYLSAGIEGRELEKEQIARELHDQLGSSIVTLTWQYDAILDKMPKNAAQYQALQKLNQSLKKLYQDIRQIAHQLGAGVLERAGLIPVLNELCNTIGESGKIEVSFSHFGLEKRLAYTYEVNILRIIQELISNVLKYADATQLMIQLNYIDGVLNIMVEDNGVGFKQQDALAQSGVGLSNIEARLRSIQGTIQFENRPKGGTTVIFHIPISKPD